MDLYIIFDVVIIAIFIVCTWHGYRRGLILGVSGILSLFIAFWGANLVADTYAAEFAPAIKPFVSGMVDKYTDEAQDAYDLSPSGDEVFTVSFNALGNMGLLNGAAEKIADELSSRFTETGISLKNGMVDKLTETISFAIVSTTAFLLIVIVFAILTNLLNLAFNLPGPLKWLNGFGGAALGFIKGLIFVIAFSWALRFLGVLIPSDAVEKTILVKFFMTHNLIADILGM